MEAPKVPDSITEYCLKHGLTEPFKVNSAWWAYPTGGVMAIPIPAKFQTLESDVLRLTVSVQLPNLSEESLNIIQESRQILENLIDRQLTEFRFDLESSLGIDFSQGESWQRLVVDPFKQLFSGFTATNGQYPDRIISTPYQRRFLGEIGVELPDSSQPEVSLVELTGFQKFQAEKFQRDNKLSQKVFDKLRSESKVVYRHKRWQYKGRQKLPNQYKSKGEPRHGRR